MLSYDFAVVGSSPLLLMFAIQLRRAGRSVILFESHARLGGAWQVEDVEGIGPVECACHLIEWYAGGYDILSALSLTPFVPSTPQPIRVFPDGRIEPYTSRSEIGRSVLGAVLSLGKALVRVALSGRGERSARRSRLARAWEITLFQLRYRLPGIVAFDAVKRPAPGYVGFMNNLQAQIDASGVDVFVGHVDAIDETQTHAVLRHGSGQTTAGRVILGESAQIDNLPDASGSAPQRTDYHHLVVGLPAGNVLLRSDYVHTPGDPDFHRVTFVRDHGDGPETRAIYLVQLRRPARDISALQEQLDILFRRCGIATSATGLVVHKEFSRQYMQRSAAGPLPSSGEIVQRVRTIGDLSRNLVMQSRTFGMDKVALGSKEGLTL